MGYSSQLTDENLPADAPANLFESPNGNWGAHGRFDDGAYPVSIEARLARHRGAIALGLLGGCIGLAALCCGWRRR
jgi:hypothetical protein